MKQHRNSQKRYYEENLIYFIVTKTFENFPYFNEDIFCDLLIEELRICKELKKFKLYGFCLIYDHLNLLIHPNKEFNVSKIMFSIKKQFSHNANRVIGNNNLKINEGEQTFVRLQDNNGNNLTCNYHKIVNKLHNQFIQKYGQNQSIIPKFKWQKSYHDHIIRNEKDFQNHHNYTVYNFQKHNLPDDWKYTSLNYSHLIDEIVL
jgi:REP element-mobilizing transposase RayT